jgi:hypothetical protein
MQRKLILGLAAVILGILIIQLHIIDAVLWFFLAGLIPGTNLSIHPLIMFSGYLIAGVLLFKWLHQRDLKTLEKKPAGQPSKAQKIINKKIAKAKKKTTNAKRKKYARGTTL